MSLLSLRCPLPSFSTSPLPSLLRRRSYLLPLSQLRPTFSPLQSHSVPSFTHTFFLFLSLSLSVFFYAPPLLVHIRSWPQRFLCIYQVNLADSDRTRSSYKPGMFDDWLLSVFRQKMVEVSSRRHKNCYYHQFFVCACMKMNEQFLNLFACNLYVLSNFLKWWGVCECMLPLLYKSIFVWGKIYLQLVNCRRLDGIRISQVTAVSWK